MKRRSRFDKPIRNEFPDWLSYEAALNAWAESMRGLPLGEVEEQERPYSDPDHSYYQRCADKEREAKE